MTLHPKPTPGRTDRNCWCPAYDACLDQAVKGGWQDWSCGTCPLAVMEEAAKQAALVDRATRHPNYSPPHVTSHGGRE